MTAPNEQRQEPDDLDLDAAPIKDLDPSEEDTEAVRGGPAGTATSAGGYCPRL